MGFKIKYKNKEKQSRAGSVGYGGVEATPPPASPLPLVPLPSPSPNHMVLPVSPLTPARPPSPPADKDADKVPDDEDWREEEDYVGLGEVEDDDDWLEDDQHWEEVEVDQDLEKEKPTRSSLNKFYAMFMSEQRNIPHYIGRYDSVPLNKHEYFSPWRKWNQLLDGKRTYLRPPRDYRVLNDVFRCPDARARTLGYQEPLLDLIHDSPYNYIILERIKVLSQHYLLFRRTRQDGSCFYRALFFSYLENLEQMQDSQAEVTRLMECVANSKENFSHLKWDNAYFLNPEEYFSSVVSDFNYLVKSVANGLNSDELYKRSMQETMSFRILSLLRLLTEIEIRAREEDYISFIPKEMSVLETVRPLDVEAFTLQMRALTYALGIPLRIEAVDESLPVGAVKVKRLDFFPRSESGKGPLHLIESYHSSSTIPKLIERGNGSLLSSDGTPLLTLLCRPGRCDILYRK